MKILLIADPLIPVPPVHYGGAERIVALYAKEFQRVGHEVVLLAGPDSKLAGGKVIQHRAPRKWYLSRAYRKLLFQCKSLLAARNCDVVYNHGRFDYLEALLAIRKPLVHRFANPVNQEQIKFAEARAHKNLSLHLISKSQASCTKIRIRTLVAHNPVDTEMFRPADEQEDYLVFLGRLTYNKGVDICIAAAHQTGSRLIIAGNIPREPGGQAYFREVIAPHLDNHRIVWVGPVNDTQKQVLLSRGKALLFPIRWDEPFGIVMAEALACGCPVIATNRASTPEVIEHGVTGFLCDRDEPSSNTFADAISNISLIDRKACRMVAGCRFDVKVLAPRVLAELEYVRNGRPPG